MYALTLAGCAAPLVPGETVIGVDVAAEVTWGGEGDRLGASVAASEGGWLAAAPGSGTTWWDGVEEEGASTAVGWWGDLPVRATREGEVWVDGALTWTVDTATAWAIGPNGILAATPAGLRLVNEDRGVEVDGLGAVGWGESRMLAMVCDPDCEGRAWDLDGEPLGAFAEGGAAGAVGEWDGVAWAGAPAWDEPEAAGRVCAEDGRCVDGLPGDHLGAAIGGGYSVGTFNKWVVPARARIVPLGGGDVLVMEEGAEIQPIVLDGDPLVIGAPYLATGGAPAGAVIEVEE